MDDGHHVRIAIADGHAMFRDGLRKLLETQPDFQVVGEACDGLEASRITRQLRPHVLLLEIDMPCCSGLATLRDLHRFPPTTRPLLLVARISNEELIEALCVGARGLVMKASVTHLLFKGIRTVMEGQYWLGRDNISGVIRELCDRRRATRRGMKAELAEAPSASSIGGMTASQRLSPVTPTSKVGQGSG